MKGAEAEPQKELESDGKPKAFRTGRGKAATMVNFEPPRSRRWYLPHTTRIALAPNGANAGSRVSLSTTKLSPMIR